MSAPALLLAGLMITGSSATASSLLAAITISAAIGGPLLGVLMDRSARPGRLLAQALAAYAAALGAILVVLGRAHPVVTILIALGAGLLGPALSAGWTSQLALISSGPELRRASDLDAMTFNVAALSGPALAGGVAGVFGASAAVAASVALICVAIPAARMLPARPGRRAQPLGADLAAGFKAIARIRPLARATRVSVISCVGQGMLVACTPLLGAQALGSPERGAYLLAVIAASALAANVVMSRLTTRPDTVMWLSTLVMGGAFLLAAVRHPAAVIGAAVVAGVGEGPQLTALFAVRHREAPEQLRGQIFTTGASLKITGFAVGAAVAGLLVSRSLAGTLVVAAATQLVAAGTRGVPAAWNSGRVRRPGSGPRCAPRRGRRSGGRRPGRGGSPCRAWWRPG
ncbi:MFS transporter [Actinomadura barringtoniae]|uniref:MFS transporter n=2 Tax=Actinomadura barringtoniae TaxID=1427535 RepID=A0A939PLW4_9ACTN|nr:MFS transporter [Actinomadura barringtoniae]